MRPIHPLALLLAARLRPGARVLYVGSERSRTAGALAEMGLQVETKADAGAPNGPGGTYDAAISTHALLHGTPAEIAAALAGIAAALPPRAPFHATFGNRADARFGSGTAVGEATFVPISGDEAGVPHSFFDDAELRALVEPAFEIESVAAQEVDDVAGTWAHGERPLEGAVHWFVVARRRDGQ